MPYIVSREEWLAARKALLEQEKALTRQSDLVAEQRQLLPWVRVDKTYTFHTTGGDKTLSQLFDGRGQLIVYHFMFGPEWERGCKSCSFWADNFDGFTEHLRYRDTTLLAVSRAPLDKLLAYKEQMGWRFEWVSSQGSDFNHDYHVSFAPQEQEEADYNYAVQSVGDEMPGVSVFAKRAEDDGTVGVYHTYSAYGRGLDRFNAAYQYLDSVPKGRDEKHFDFPMGWLERRGDYGEDVG